MRVAERYKAFVEYFSQHMPSPRTELVYDTPFELLVAVILSAQCLDKRVNQATPALFAAFPTPGAMARARADEVLPFIRMLSYPNSKAQYLVTMARQLCEDFHGEIPSRLEELVQLAGVGRKTANIIRAEIFHQPALGVDTHVMRVSKRLGLVDPRCKTPLSIEVELLRHLPPAYHRIAHHWLVLHGRYICLARKPKCHQCPLTHFCHYYETQVKGGIT